MKRILMLMGLFFSVYLLFPLSALAEDPTTTLSCPASNNAGTSFNCSISTSMAGYEKIEISVASLGTGVTLGFSSASGVTGSINGNTITITSYSVAGVLGNLQIKFPNSTTGSKKIELNNIKYYTSEGSAVLPSVSTNITVKSTNNVLTALSVSNCTITPNFNGNTTIYTSITTASTVTITATAPTGATISGTGSKTLNMDDNTFNVVVTAESGDKKTYKITIIRIKETVADNTLKSITLSNGELSPKFSASVTSYSATVDAEKVKISAVSNDSKATIDGVGEKSLEYGKNEFKITVTSTSGEKKVYTITITRTDDRNANANLKSLTIDGKSIGFKKNITEYEYTLKKLVDKVEIKAVAEKDTSKVEIKGNNNLKEGKNTITITVTAEDKSEKVYTIVVIIAPNDSAVYLQKLTIENYKISFNQEQLEYTVKINDEDKLDITALADDEDSIIEIVGNKNLKNGSIIKIIVTGADGSSTVYQIKISKEDAAEECTEANGCVEGDINYIPYIMYGLLGLLTLLNLIQIIKKIKNGRKNKVEK